MNLLVWVLALGIASYLIFYVFFPLARGALYDPSSPEETRLMVEMALPGPGEKAVDLGSGDGRIVIMLAHRGVEAHGFEVNPILVALSRRKIRREGLLGIAFIHWRSFWRADLSTYDIVTVFQVGFVMGRLEAKLKREASPSARIVSHYWKFPSLLPERTRGNIRVYRIV
jgi:hypothetical protein